MGINDSGQVVGLYGYSYNLDTGINTGLAFFAYGFLLSGGSYTRLDVPGARFTQAFGINDSGQVVGYYFVSDQGLHGFLLSGGGYTSFDLPGASAIYGPFGINDSGQVVGWYYGANGEARSFLLSGGSYTRLDVPGVSATEASGINDSGQVVGTYRDASGGYHGFIATPYLPPDLVATSLAWDTAQGGVDFSYAVEGSDLTQDTTAALYWASGTTPDTRIGGPVYETPVEHWWASTGRSTSPTPCSGPRPTGPRTSCSWSTPTRRSPSPTRPTTSETSRSGPTSP